MKVTAHKDVITHAVNSIDLTELNTGQASAIIIAMTRYKEESLGLNHLAAAKIADDIVSAMDNALYGPRPAPVIDNIIFTPGQIAMILSDNPAIKTLSKLFDRTAQEIRYYIANNDPVCSHYLFVQALLICDDEKYSFLIK